MTLRPTTERADPTHTHQRPPLLLTGVFLAAILAPLSILGAAYALSVRAWMVLGSWPRPWLDDPKFIAPHDPAMTVLQGLVLGTLVWAYVSPLLVVVLLRVLSRSISTRWLSVGIVVLGSGWLLVLLDPGARLKWFVD